MTNLDSILKSRDITLPTKVRLVKAMVFPVVVYGCESWTIKKKKQKKNLVRTTTWRKEQWPHKRLRQTYLCECLGVSGRGMGWQWPASGSGSLTTAVLGGVGCWYKPFWRRSTLLPLPRHCLASGETAGREHSPTHQQKIGLKTFWIWPCPPEQDPVFPTASPSHQEGKLNKLITGIPTLSNSIKQWVM